MPTDEIAGRGRRDDAGRQERVPHADACATTCASPAGSSARTPPRCARPRSACSTCSRASPSASTSWPATCPGGEQQMLAVSQALIPDPKLLLIDELSLGLAPDRRRASSSTSCTRSTRPASPSWSSSSRSTSPCRSPSAPCSWRRASSASPAPTQDLLDRPDILRSVFIAGADVGAGRPPKPRRRGAARRAVAAAAPARPAEPRGCRPPTMRRSCSSAAAW